MWPRRRRRPSPSKIERRLSGQPTSEILAWAETSLFGIGRGLRSGDDGLADAEMHAEVLLTAIREIRRRRV